MDDNTKWTKVDRLQNDTTTTKKKRAKHKKKNFHSFIIFACGVG
jgi:hypothetical protein